MEFKKQSIMALSSREAMYGASFYAPCQIIWLEVLLEELYVTNCEQIKLLVDNQSIINLANHHMNHGRRKHIEERCHFLRDQASKERLRYEYCKTELELADILTKPSKQSTSKN